MEFRLRELRQKKQLSQIRLAIDLCIPQNSISRFENGVRKPDYDTLIQIADYFNVSIDYLVGRSDNPSIVEQKSTYNNKRRKTTNHNGD